MTRTVGGVTKNYGYDANGNMINSDGTVYGWDADNRLTSAGSSSFSYDYTGRRVKKVTPAGTTIYPFSFYEIDATGAKKKYHSVAGEIVSVTKSVGSTHDHLYYHNDHLGGVNLITDLSGIMVELIEYDPWGRISNQMGLLDNVKKFTGQEFDSETQLYYFVGRYYHFELSHFISADPFVTEPFNPRNLNRYSYVFNNPVNNTDPSGFRTTLTDFALENTGIFNGVTILGPQEPVLVAQAGVQLPFTSATGGGGGDLNQNTPNTVIVSAGEVPVVVGEAGAARPATGTFDVPLAPAIGVVHVQIFIIAETIYGVGVGDARFFELGPNITDSRAIFILDFVRGTGNYRINPSCLTIGICRPAKPVGPEQPFFALDTESSVVISGTLVNSIFPLGAIDFSIGFLVTPSGLRFKGFSNPFPSIEIEQTIGGRTDFIFTHRETHPTDLIDRKGGFITFSGSGL